LVPFQANGASSREEFIVVLAAASGLGRGLLIAAFTAIIGSLLAWVIGSHVAYRWDDRRRRRESDLAALATFYKTYGEFFATWKVWNAYKRADCALEVTPQVQAELLDRASAVEGAFESLLVKIASERRLGRKDKLMLGCFREGYQRLRERIREDQQLAWWSSGTSNGMREYRAFKGLAEYVAFMLEQDSATVRRTAGRYTSLLTAIALRSEHRHRAELEKAREGAITNLLAVSARADFHDTWWTIAEKELNLAQASAGI
jgi:hypothetical protein